MWSQDYAKVRRGQATCLGETSRYARLGSARCQTSNGHHAVRDALQRCRMSHSITCHHLVSRCTTSCQHMHPRQPSFGA